ncbi:unnamed protein product [Danaus chrysippus]|uniref:(African queen) hypothetical protein n=1 Tax=Danaus chrysippus TaxID=151541 RepID=A0A8J2VZJ9_9NEOP|nr:unnamed protein product [Danaus chrysippus]
MRNVYIGGDLYTAIKDSSILQGTSSTITRHLDAIMKRIENREKHVILGKRWLEGEIEEEDTDQPDHKRRKGDVQGEDITYDQDVYIGEEESVEDIPDEAMLSLHVPLIVEIKI